MKKQVKKDLSDCYEKFEKLGLLNKYAKLVVVTENEIVYNLQDKKNNREFEFCFISTHNFFAKEKLKDLLTIPYCTYFGCREFKIK